MTGESAVSGLYSCPVVIVMACGLYINRPGSCPVNFKRSSPLSLLLLPLPSSSLALKTRSLSLPLPLPLWLALSLSPCYFPLSLGLRSLSWPGRKTLTPMPGMPMDTLCLHILPSGLRQYHSPCAHRTPMRGRPLSTMAP